MLAQQLGTGIPNFFDHDIVQAFRPVLRVADYLLPVTRLAPFHIKHAVYQVLLLEHYYSICRILTYPPHLRDYILDSLRQQPSFSQSSETGNVTHPDNLTTPERGPNFNDIAHLLYSTDSSIVPSGPLPVELDLRLRRNRVQLSSLRLTHQRIFRSLSAAGLTFQTHAWRVNWSTHPIQPVTWKLPSSRTAGNQFFS